MDTLRDYYESARPFRDYLEGVEKNRELWHGLYERVRLPDGAVEKARALGEPRRLLAISEDWCGDAVNVLPVVARLAEEAGWPLRVLERDANPDLMDRYLTDGSRSIPVVIILDDEFGEVGSWGPRPSELQEWVLGEGQEMPSDERYREVRRWYAEDRGSTVLCELLDAATAGARAA